MRIPKEFIEETLKTCQTLKDLGLFKSFKVKVGVIGIKLTELGRRVCVFRQESPLKLLASFIRGEWDSSLLHDEDFQTINALTKKQLDSCLRAVEEALGFYEENPGSTAESLMNIAMRKILKDIHGEEKGIKRWLELKNTNLVAKYRFN